MDPTNELLVCTISGHCFDRWLLPSENGTLIPRQRRKSKKPIPTGQIVSGRKDQQQGGMTDEAEPFMGSGRFARAYLLGYNCDDDKELEAALRVASRVLDLPEYAVVILATSVPGKR
ncbi:hypothetical protein NC652_012303 [Populus alba x Populus x berolinensis]|nr:hypothetical protein NC652_012303 [Populus alba x Populus x berolinensis]